MTDGSLLDRVYLEKILQNEPMIETAPSVRAALTSFRLLQGGSVYYGTGLSTPKALSIGLPFDVLGMVLTAERMRQRFGLGNIYHHIADSHALSNSFASSESVGLLTQTVEFTLGRVAAHLGLKHFHVVRSSSFDGEADYKSLLQGIHTDKHEYVKRELADIRWYKKHKDVALKVGWVIQAGPIEEGFDERLYDNEYRRLFGDDLTFIYTKAGRTFDRSRPKASPYISIPGEQRVLLKPNEGVQDKIDQALKLWPDKTLGGALNHLKAIVRLYDQVAATPAVSGPLGARIQSIIDRIFE